jgi:hypothetical protein
MKASNQATARSRTYLDYGPAGLDSNFSIFRGMKTGAIVALALFWFPCIAVYYLFGWLYVLAYGTVLVAVFSVLGLMSRNY